VNVTSGISLFGSTGFIGNEICKSSQFEINRVDRNNPDPKFENIIYAIGTTDNYNIFENPTLDIETNLMKLIDDLELLRNRFGKFTFNYLSSWFVYGDTKDLPFKEDQQCNPKGFYSISKYAAEMFLRSYCETFKIDFRILRLSNVYGVGDTKASQKKNALQFLINEIKSGNDIELYEGGDFVRDYMNVTDVVRAIDLIVQKGPTNEITNIGTGVPVKFLDLIVSAIDANKSMSKILSITTPEFHKIVQVRDSYLDVTKLEELGFKPNFAIMNDIIHL
jgi:nucleoside-diphosphate-sugar epimerase